MSSTVLSTTRSRRFASLTAAACATAVLATTFGLAAPATKSEPATGSAPAARSHRFTDLDDNALWGELQSSHGQAVVGLKSPGAKAGMKDGAVLVDAGDWSAGKSSVTSKAGVTLLAADDLRPNVTVGIDSLDSLKAVRHSPFVEFVEPRGVALQSFSGGGSGCTGNDWNADPEGGDVYPGLPATVAPGDKFPNNFGPSLIQEAWARGATGAGVTVGVVDTGSFSTQEQLQQPQFSGGWSGGRTVTHLNAANQPSMWDECNHGTRVASTIAAPRDGINMVGIAWKANLVSSKHGADVFIDAWETDAVTLAIRGAVNNGARIIEMAFGTGSWEYDNIRQEIQFWNARNVLFVGAAGTGYCLEGVLFPAKMPEVLAVTGTTPDGQVAPDSCTGPEVDLGAVAVDSFAAGRRSTDIITMGGSSVASAIVSGVAALVWEQNPGLTKDQVRARLVNSGNYCCTTGIGSGTVNAYKAIGGYAGLSISGPMTVDPYTSYTLTAAPQGNGPFTYQWSNGATTPSITATAGANGTSKTFTVTVTDTREGKTLTATKTVRSKTPIEPPTCLKYCP